MNLVVHVEGQTEESFVNELLRPHLVAHGYSAVRAGFIGGRHGGITSWTLARNDITKHLREDGNCVATTMVDYYRLPRAGAARWPGRAQASQLPHSEKAPAIEAELARSVHDQMGPDFRPSRFVPYVMMHEFEALLFSDCVRFASAIARPRLAAEFQQVRDGFSSPEEIDDTPLGAPSKRIETLVPGYQKPLMGTLAALEIGLPKMRTECPHFERWIACLEPLPGRA